MVGFIVCLFKLVILFFVWLWLRFIEYIEWFDAAVLGFIAYLAAYHYDLSNNTCIAAGIAVAVLFLLVFKTRIGWWISTGVFSLMWAYLAGALAVGLFHANDIVRWVVIAGAFCYCVFLHSYAKDRKQVNKLIAAEEAQERARKNIDPEEERQRNLAAQRRIQAKFDEINRLAELKEKNSQKSHT